MIRLLLFFTVIVSLNGFSQPFDVDTFGIVRGTGFQEFLQKRGYVLAGAFRNNDTYFGLTTNVYDGGLWIVIGLNGEKAILKQAPIDHDYLPNDGWGDDVDDFSPVQYEPVISLIKKNGKQGYSHYGKTILAPTYDSVTRFDQYGLFYLKVKRGELWGIADYQGKFIIPANYKEITSATSAFICQNNDGFQAINRKGETFLKAKSPIHEYFPGLFSWNTPDRIVNMADLYGHTYVLPKGNDGPNSKICSIPDELAAYPGGHPEMMKFIEQNLRYPQIAIENHIEGKVYLKFIVESDGTIANIDIQRGIADCRECDKEAKRLISIMPPWTAGTCAGRPTRSYFNLPIRFKL